jgi:class 3 adenylate cyclase/tetratricopeptide (TPR) repeat protein
MDTKCSNCKTPISIGQRFCPSCGQATHTCPKCMSVCALGAKFCDNCGNKLSSEEGASQPSPDAAQVEPPSGLEDMRKHITVMFADMKGSTAAIQDLDPEEARNILAPILAEMKNAVFHYGGTIIHTLGDGLVVVFGAPEAQEDHALRASLAALHMLKATPSINKDINIRVGLNSGEVLLEVVGKYHDEYDIAGPVVNLAARMEQTAMPGTVKITRNTLLLIENDVVVEPLGSEKVKGFNEQIEVFELKTIKKNKSLFDIKNRVIYSQFTGRDVEMKQLEQLFLQAMSGKGNAVNIVGSMGQGKSRLCYEFSNTNLTSNCNICIACGYSHTQSLFLSPFINLFRDIVEVEKLSEDLSEDEIKKNIQPFIVDLDVPYALDAAYVLFGIAFKDDKWNQLDPQLKHKCIFQTGIGILSNLSLKKPLVLILEDLQWFDLESESFINLLISHIDKLPIFVISTCRPEYANNWGDKPHCTQLSLNPLKKEDEQHILAGLIGDDSDLTELKRKIVKDCDGNPFFIEEMVKLLISEKIIVKSAHHYKLNNTALVNQIQLPATIYAVLQTRIDKLPLLQKKVLHVASVIGEQFKYQLILKLMDTYQKNLDSLMSELCKGQYIYEISLFPEPEFAFKNMMVQEVSYNNLLIRERKVLHSNILNFYETHYKEPSVTQVHNMAHHAYFSEQWGKAFSYYLIAAKNAFLINALELSLQLYNQVLSAAEHIDKDEKTIEQLIYAHLEMSHILLRLGKPHEQEMHLTQGLDLAIMIKSTPLESAIFTFKTIFCLGLGNSDDSIELALHAYGLAENSNSSDVLLVSKTALLHAYFFTGQYKKLYEVAQDIVDNLSDLNYFPEFYGVPPGHLTYVLMFVAKGIEGDFISMKTHQEIWLLSVNLEEISTNTYFVTCGLGMYFYSQGEYNKASFYLLKGLRNSVELNYVMTIPVVASQLACINLRMGELTEGKKYLEQAIHIGKLVHFSFISVLSLGDICEGLLLLGETERTREFITMAFDICRKRNLRWLIPCLLRLEAGLDLHLSEPGYSQNEQKITRALELAQTLQLQSEVAHCYLALARLYEKMGKIELRSEAANTALQTYKKLDMPYWVSQCTSLPRTV